MGSFMEIFTLVTGVIYIILEIRQKNLMWVVGILTSLAAMWVFFRQGLYASFGLNTYYLVTSVIAHCHNNLPHNDIHNWRTNRSLRIVFLCLCHCRSMFLLDIQEGM